LDAQRHRFRVAVRIAADRELIAGPDRPFSTSTRIAECGLWKITRATARRL
jgi:hypothetical protein